MRPPVLVILLLGLLLGTGCAGLELEWPGREQPGTDPPAAGGVVVLLEVQHVPFLGDGSPERMRLARERRRLGNEFDPSRPILRDGDGLNARIVARNLSSDPVTLHFNSGKKFDLLLLDSRGATVWSAGQDRAYTAALQELTLGPGEEISQQEVVSIPLPGTRLEEGRYSFVGALEGMAKVRSEPQQVEYRPTP